MNKKIIFFVMALLCLYNTTYAQVDLNDEHPCTYTQDMDSFFSKLSWQTLPDSNFYDRVYPFAGLSEFDNRTDTIDMPYFLQAYSELERSQWKIAENDSIFNHDDFHHFIDGSNQNNEIPFFAIQQNINFIDSNSINNSMLNDSTGLMIQAKTGNPYVRKKINIVAAGVGSKLYVGVKYKIDLLQPTSINNAARNITKLVIKSTAYNKQWVWTENAQEDFEIENAGKDVWQIDAYEDDEIIFTTNQNVNARMQNPSGDLADMCADYFTVKGVGADPLHPGYQGMYETHKYQGDGEYVIFYGRNGSNDHSCNKVLNKPLVISDAWDPLDVRQIFTKADPNVPWFNYNNHPYVEDIYHKHMTWTDDDTKTGTPHNLVEDARNKGYDVIIVNYNDYETDFVNLYINDIRHNHPISLPSKTIDGGSDYIQRNAQVFQKVIDEIKAKTNNEIVIIGPSMGGQITRYALRDYELRNIPHHCRLWVSFDSPQYGANIPFGIQKTIETLALKEGKAGAKLTLNSQLAAPAANQMLISQLSHPTEPDQNMNQQGFSPLHLAYYSEIFTMGMPTQCRKIALVNGTYTGGHYHEPGSRMFNITGTVRRIKTISIRNRTSFMSSNNMENSFTHKFRNLSAGLITKYIDGDSHGFLDIIGPLDAINGGMYDVQDDFYDANFNEKRSSATITTTNGEIKIPVKDGNVWLCDTTHNMCFIPTYSGLSITSHNFSWETPINIQDLVCNNETPFDNFYSPPNNQSHTFLSKDNVAWVMQEIDKGKKDPTCFTICNITFNGNHCLLAGGSSNYSISGTLNPSNAVLSIYWRCSNGLSFSPSYLNISPSTTLTNVLVYAKPTASSDEWVEAEIVNPCGANTIRRFPVQSITPTFTLAWDFINPLSCFHQVTVSSTSPLKSKYQWSNDGVTFTAINSFFNTNTFGKFKGASLDVGKSVWVKITDYCGRVITLQTTFTVNIAPFNGCQLKKEIDNGTGNYIGVELKVYPNPTNNNWTVESPDYYKKRVAISLTDITGKLYYTRNYYEMNNTKIIVPAENLATNIYILKILIDEKVHYLKLIKE
jgi:hypothetical protein